MQSAISHVVTCSRRRTWYCCGRQLAFPQTHDSRACTWLAIYQRVCRSRAKTLHRAVGVFSSARADAWPLVPLLEGIEESQDLYLLVLIAETRRDGQSGSPPNELLRFPHVLVDACVQNDQPADFVDATTRLSSGVASILSVQPLDMLVVLGDRWELLPTVTTALLLGVPTVHLHGGEVTEGAIDERVRHAVTKLADVHLCATEAYGRRIRQLGEEDWRVHVTGAPSLDRLADVTSESLEVLGGRLGITLSRPLGIVTFHPPTAESVDLAEAARLVLDSAADHLGSAVVTFPGVDAGGEVIVEEIHRARRRHGNLFVVPSLGADYAVCLATADVMIGNSSSGIIEAPTFGLPVVNVGDRQHGRIMGDNVIQASLSREALDTAIVRALSPDFREMLAGMTNPYGDGKAVPRIIDILRHVPLAELRRKRFVDWGENS